ncbi:MAG: SCO family protein [Phycisphaerales bacterium]|nr:SCO family protein [Phycisphaerales bacterium]
MNLRRVISGLLAVATMLLAPGHACAQPGGSLPALGSAGDPDVPPEQIEGVGVTERLGEQIPLDLPFTNAEGELVPLRAYFNQGKPVILAMVYYDCPIVCTIVMGQLTEAFKGIDFDIGDDYTVVFASIDPSEPHSLAASVKTKHLAAYDRPHAANAQAGWAFLTSDGDSSRTLAQSLGWNYKPIAGGEFSHPVCIFVLTPEGRIARYVYGVGYEPDTMRMALLEASDGKISDSIGDKVRMFCFRYDPTTGKYAMVAYRVVQLGGVASILVVGSLIAVMLTKERIRLRRALPASAPTQTPAAGFKS